VAGSHAHGLETENSDIDYHGVYSAPSQDFWKLQQVPDSIVRKDPDRSYHELRKFLLLGLKSNPTILELLYLNEYEEKEPGWGDMLLDIRSDLLSASAVKSAYLGYANAQMKRMKARSFEGQPKRDKLLRHSFRLLNQGLELYTKGRFQTKVVNRNFYFDLPSLSPEVIEDMYRKGIERFDKSESFLPEYPNYPAIEEYLVSYRRSHLHG